MFNSFSENSSLQHINEDFKQSTDDLCTDVHRNNNIEKSDFSNEEETIFNCSFGQGEQKIHAQTIYDAFLIHLESALSQGTSCYSGLNNQQVYVLGHENVIPSGDSFEHIILRNDVLTTQQKSAFINMLQNEQQLMGLLLELLQMFRKPFFDQITYLIYQICEKRKQLHYIVQKNTQLSKLVLPFFKCFSNLQNLQTLQKIPYSPYKERKTHEEVKKQAEVCFNSIAKEMYYDRRLQLINFRECKKDSKNERKIRQSFLSFFQILTTEVYLSLEGFFSEFQDQEEEFLDSDSEDELQSQLGFRSACSLEKFIPLRIRHVREPGHFEGQGRDQETNNGGRKRKKLE